VVVLLHAVAASEKAQARPNHVKLVIVLPPLKHGEKARQGKQASRADLFPRG
jgi:hypothetical protein